MKKFIKKPSFILAVILAAFFLKGVFIAVVFPIFTGQDEARHYNTVQFLAEPEEKTWEITKKKYIRDKESILDYNFSREIRETGLAADFDIVRHSLFDTVRFSDGYDGANEAEINSEKWKPYNYLYPPDTAGKSLYHILASFIEKLFASQSIFVRFYLIRIFSVLVGTLTILLSYFIAKNVGFRPQESLILTAIVAFQPKLSIYTTNINYDALLIPLFSLFTYGAILSLKDNLNWKNICLMIAAIVLGFYTKGTALVLLPVFAGLVLFHLYKKFGKEKNIFSYLSAILLLFIFIFLAFRASGHSLGRLLPFKGNVAETVSSLKSYLDKSLTSGRFGLSSRTYWGSLGWEDNWFSNNFTDIVWSIELVAAAGLIWFLFSKKKPDFLPEKKYIIFLMLMIISLQLGIRLFDWRVFTETGSLVLGTPGRYFLPNLTAHIILVFTGLGMLLRKENYFRNSLIAGLILMFSFCMYLIFNVVLPRYYL